MEQTKTGGVILSNTYEAFIWTGGEDQKHDPLWFVEYLKSNKGHIKNSGTPDVYIRHLGPDITPGHVIVRDGLGSVSSWMPAAFRVYFGEDQYQKLT